MKIGIVYADAFSIWIFHRYLLETLKRDGHDVYVISANDEYAARFEEIGVCHIPVRMCRHMSVLKDFRLFLDFLRVFRTHQFDLVHTFTIKPNTFGAIAAKLAGTKRIVATAEGLGFMYGDDPGLMIKMARPIADLLYRLGAWASDRFWFVNPDDRDLFVSRRIVSRKKAFLTISAGVNLDEYYPGVVDARRLDDLRKELGFNQEKVVVTMVAARMIWSKGVNEFFDAAELLKGQQLPVEFLLVGPIEKDSPESAQECFLRQREHATGVRWLGFRRDIKSIYAISDIVVLPSYYREGVPNVLLEAMALGKAVVTTDSVGCREVVEHGRNGFLIPVRDSGALARALEILIVDTDMRTAFGAHSRSRVEQEFDKRTIVSRVITELYGGPEAE